MNDPLNDVDGDGICGDIDNCPEIAKQVKDANGDGIGDACAPNDADSDGIIDEVDNSEHLTLAKKTKISIHWVMFATRAQPIEIMTSMAIRFVDRMTIAEQRQTQITDTDGDDVVITCPNDVDGDSDGLCADQDNCPLNANADQADSIPMILATCVTFVPAMRKTIVT